MLFGVTMAVLLMPKFFGLVIALHNADTRNSCGGGKKLVISTLLEVLMSALIAPIMMVIQTGSVMQIIFGRDTGWNPQRRDDGSIPLRDIIRRHRSHVALGIVTLIAGLLISPSLVAWMSPTIAGLILAIAISWASGQLFIGLALKRAGLLLTPEESVPPAIAVRANALASQLAADGQDESDGIRAIHTDKTLRAHHDLFLPPANPRRRGQIEPDRAIAIAKLNDAETLEDAVNWLKPKERMVVLHDRALIDMIARLPATSAAATPSPKATNPA